MLLGELDKTRNVKELKQEIEKRTFIVSDCPAFVS